MQLLDFVVEAGDFRAEKPLLLGPLGLRLFKLARVSLVQGLNLFIQAVNFLGERLPGLVFFLSEPLYLRGI